MSANVHGKTLPLFGEEVVHESWEKITVLPLPFRTLDVTQRDGVRVYVSVFCQYGLQCLRTRLEEGIAFGPVVRFHGNTRFDF